MFIHFVILFILLKVLLLDFQFTAFFASVTNQVLKTSVNMLISCPPPKYSQKKTLYSEPYTTPHMANLEGTSHVKEHSPTPRTHKNVITNLKDWISSCSAALDLRIASSVGRQVNQDRNIRHINMHEITWIYIYIYI